jgi:hypothetical protein
MEFDRFDICEAWYLFASDYHDGQWSKLYRVFGRLNKIKFKPSPMLSYDSLSDNGKEIYDNLVANLNRG